MKNLVSHLKRLDRFVVLTHEDGASWSELPKVEVIPDPLSFSPQVQSSLSSKRIIAAGRYVYQKGFDLLLHAWASVEKRCPDWELVIFGAGDRTPYERLASELSLQRCSLNGPTADIEKEYLNSSLFAFSSRFEGFGMVLIEAMACGLPVVSFACPCGPKDIITDGIDGLLVENGNVSQLAEKIIYMIEHPEERTRMGANAVIKSARYKIDRLAKDWQQLFESL
jgi:glycosyltransferase involved in cell wall biosynthesis